MAIAKSPEAIELERYMGIVNGNDKVIEFQDHMLNESVMHFGNVKVGDYFMYEDGTQWIKIVAEENDNWKVSNGLAGNTGDELFVTKTTISTLLRENEIYQCNEKIEMVNESVNDGKYEIFLENVDRYLFRNYQMDINEVDANWRDLFEDGSSPSSAAEFALL